MLTISNVSKAYDGVPILKNISLTLKEGLTHVLLGSSGSGKSTLLRHILGLEIADAGRIVVGGIEVAPSHFSAVTRRIGYVVQSGGLFPHLTGRQNIMLVAKKEKWDQTKARERLQFLAELTRIDDGVLGRYPKELSGGQQQRISLMRALFLDPPFLLLDEPLAALDPIVRSVLQDELKRIFNTLRKTVLIVTHDLAEASFFGHTITLLHDGTVLQHGTFEDFLAHPAAPYVTQFISAQRPVFEFVGQR